MVLSFTSIMAVFRRNKFCNNVFNYITLYQLQEIQNAETASCHYNLLLLCFLSICSLCSSSCLSPFSHSVVLVHHPLPPVLLFLFTSLFLIFLALLFISSFYSISFLPFSFFLSPCLSYQSLPSSSAAYFPCACWEL